MSEAPNPNRDPRRLVNGARVGKRETQKLRRKLVPAMPLPEPEDDRVKREAYQLALANRRKPWARRYLKLIANGRLRAY